MPDFIIRDFQSITEAKIPIKGFTIIVGDSSAGKSACLRAMFAATHNRFKIGQVQHGKEFIEVKVRYEDDDRILVVRRNQTGSPVMKLGDQVFSKMARCVPQEVEEFNNFGTLDVGNDIYSLNFHEQFQKPLLLEYSQKKVMEILSASKSLDDLQVVHYALSKKREQNRGAFKTVEALVNENNAKLSMLKYDLSQTEPSFKRVQELYNGAQDIESKLDALNNLQGLIGKYKRVDQTCDILVDALAESNKIVSTQDRLDSVSKLSALIKDRVLSESRDELLGLIISGTDRVLGLVSPQKVDDFTERWRVYEFVEKQIERKEKIHNICVEGVKHQSAQKHSTDFSIKADSLKSLLRSMIVLENREKQLIDVVEKHICPVCGSNVE